MCLEARCEQGTLLDPCPGCTEAAEQAALAKEPVVIHRSDSHEFTRLKISWLGSVQGTKTNARDPFPPVAPTAKAENLKDYFMVVDACQGRVTNEELKGWLDAGAMILLTGSKFYQVCLSIERLSKCSTVSGSSILWCNPGTWSNCGSIAAAARAGQRSTTP